MRVETSTIRAYIVAITTLAVAGIGFYALIRQFNVFLTKERVDLRRPLDAVPTTIGRWSRIGPDNSYSDIMLEELGTRSYLDRTYAINGDPAKGALHVHVAYYTGTIDAVPHIPERCWAVGGLELTQNSEPANLDIDRSKWRPSDVDGYFTSDVIDPVTADIESVTMPVGDLVATTIEFQDPKSPKIRQVGGYFFIANGRLESSSYGVRRAAFNLSDRYAYYCKVQVTKKGLVDDEDGSLIGPFKEDATELLGALLPEVMRCLPDWPEWEAKARGGAAVGGTSGTG
ncbi:MAG: exosortase-associated EpsI family protein [bacterium]